MSFAVLVVDDDFRVARLHARLVEDVPDFRVVGVAHSAEQAGISSPSTPRTWSCWTTTCPTSRGSSSLRSSAATCSW